MVRNIAFTLILFTTGLAASGCSALYYDTMETFGVDKREILVDRVKDARDEQDKAKEQFSSALEEFQTLVGYDGGNLEKMYNKLNDEYEDSKSRAERVRDRIDSIDSVAEALFDEWEDELDQYGNLQLQRTSERQLVETRNRYEDMLRLMRDASAKMDPVLQAFQDQVLFLKHNLNARAIASLEGDVQTLQDDVAALIADMEASIAEADAFIAQMDATG